MKKLLHLLLLAPLLAFAQPTPPGGAPPASQAEVDAGVVRNKYVSPYTLNNWSGGGGGGTPGGSSGDWQINNAGSFAGIAPASGWDTLFVTPTSANFGTWLTDGTGTGLVVFDTSPTIAAPTLTGTTTATTVSATTLTATSFTFNSVSVTGPTGTGNMVLATSPTLVTPTLGVASATSVNKWVFTAPTTAATLTAGGDSLTYTMPASSQTIPGLTNTVTFTGKTYQLSGALGTDDTLEGTTVSGLTAGATIAQWEAVYVGGSSTYLLADANGSSTFPARGLAVAAYSSTNAAIILIRGTVRNDAWTWTPGGTIYLSATAGSLTQTAPGTSGDKVQAVGVALTADIALFDFDSTYVTVQ